MVSKVLIIYYSGVGNTQKVAEMMFTIVKDICDSEIYSIGKIPSGFDINQYNAVIIGFPTIHTAPAKPIVKLIHDLNCLDNKIPAFIFTTCGLYSGNTVKIFDNQCIHKNIIPVFNKSYRCSATDGTLLAPFMKCWFKDEKNLLEKVKSDALQFAKMDKTNLLPVIPKTKWYSVINFPNKWLGQRLPFPIYLHKEKCIKCSKCIVNCPVKAYSTSNDGFPMVFMEKCVHCYRCIHHCPQLALSLSKKRAPTKTLHDDKNSIERSCC